MSEVGTCCLTLQTQFSLSLISKIKIAVFHQELKRELLITYQILKTKQVSHVIVSIFAILQMSNCLRQLRPKMNDGNFMSTLRLLLAGDILAENKDDTYKYF